MPGGMPQAPSAPVADTPVTVPGGVPAPVVEPTAPAEPVAPVETPVVEAPVETPAVGVPSETPAAPAAGGSNWPPQQ